MEFLKKEKNVTKYLDFDFLKEKYFLFKYSKFLEALEESKAYVSGSSILHALKGNPYYKKEKHFLSDLDIYVNLDNCEPILSYLTQFSTIEKLCQSTPYDGSFFKRNHILQNLTLQGKIENRGISIDLMFVKNSVKLENVLSNFDLTCCQNWLKVNPDLNVCVYSTDYQSVRKGECKLNQEYVHSLNQGNEFIKNRLQKYTDRGFKISIPSSVYPVGDLVTNDCEQGARFTTFLNVDLKGDQEILYNKYRDVYFEKLVNYINTKPFYSYKQPYFKHMFNGKFLKSITYTSTKKFEDYELRKYKMIPKLFINKENLNSSIPDNLNYIEEKYVNLCKYHHPDSFDVPLFVSSKSKSKYKMSEDDRELYYSRSLKNIIYGLHLETFHPRDKDDIAEKQKNAITYVCESVKEISRNYTEKNFIDIDKLPKILEVGPACSHPLCDDDGNINIEEIIKSDREDVVIVKKMNDGEIKIIDVIEKSQIQKNIQDKNNSSVFFICPKGFKGRQFTVEKTQVNLNKCFVKFDTLIGPQYIHWSDVCYMHNSPSKLFMFEDVYKEERFINASLVIGGFSGQNLFGGQPNAVSAVHCGGGSYIINKMYECNEPKEFYQDGKIEKEKEIEKPTLEELQQRYAGLKEIMESEDDYNKKVRSVFRLGIQGGDMQHITDYLRGSASLELLEPEDNDDYDPYLDGPR